MALLETYQATVYAPYWQHDIQLYRTFGTALISAGHPTRAFELVRTGLHDHADEPTLQYLSALALARGGNASAAMERVNKLLQVPGLEPHLMVESYSLAGRIAKDQYAQTHRVEDAAQAASLYEQAHHLSTNSFPSINAATMALLANQPAQARAFAVLAEQYAIGERQQPARNQDYWLLATLGEACLHLGKQQEAVQWYRQAVEHVAGQLGDIASMRRQVQLLAEKMTISNELLKLFDVGHVVVFSGHMIDHPTRLTQHLPPRFPPDAALEDGVRQALTQALADLNATVGYSSAACGSDILFAEQMLAGDKELHIVLPFKQEDFYTTSVDFGLDAMAGWRKRYQGVLAQAAEVHYATTQPFLGDDILFTFVNTFTQGLAMTRAAHLGVEPYALVVREPTAAEPIGGTSYFLQSWQAGGHRVASEIDLAALRSRCPQPLTTWSDTLLPASPVPRGPLKREVKAMLFGDVKNFSHLGDEQIPGFLANFSDEVAGILAQTQPPPAFCNTWGDGLFLVFHTVRECADFALHLLNWLGTVRWEAIGFPADMTMRLGLHAGPVYPYMDKIISRQNFFGSHVNRAARIEPVTTPGCAYASEQFAALVAVECGDDFVCDYVGVEDLAKDYDRCPLYRLRRRV